MVTLTHGFGHHSVERFLKAESYSPNIYTLPKNAFRNTVIILGKDIVEM